MRVRSKFAVRRFSALAALCVLWPFTASATNLFQVDQYYGDFGNGIGFSSGGGIYAELQFLGRIHDTPPGGPVVGSWLNGVVGEATATLSFYLSFGTDVRVDADRNGTFELLNDRGNIAFLGEHIQITALDGAFDGVFHDPHTGQEIAGWQSERWATTQTNIGRWDTDINTLVVNGYRNVNLLPLVAKPRAASDGLCQAGQTICYTGSSLFSWLMLQYAPHADIALDIERTFVTITPMPVGGEPIPEPMTMTLLAAGLFGAGRLQRSGRSGRGQR